MDLLRTFFSRIASMFRSSRLDASLDDELRAHIDLAVADHMRRGVTEIEARHFALCEFGGVTQVRETYREQRGIAVLEEMYRDIRFGLFQLWKSPGFTLTAILTLALGVGANTTVFSMINGLLLRPLPVPESGSLIVLGVNVGGPSPNFSFSEPLLRALERQHGALGTVFAFAREPFQVKSGSTTDIAYGQYVSGGFFQTLQTQPILGRTLNAQDDRKGGDSAGFAVVISETLWANRFQRSPDVLGRRLVINNTPFTIVGVMPRSFVGADPLQRPQIFVPLADEQVLAGAQSLIGFGKGAWWLGVMARLAPGATVTQANSQVAAATGAILHQAVSDAAWIKRMQDRHIALFAESGSTGSTYIRLQFRRPLMAVFAMCGGILLLACLNLAGLLMARGTARQRELATRMALGASRRRLLQQLLVEGLLLALTGTAAGLALAPAVSRLLVAILLSGQDDVHLDTSLDMRVFAFAVATTVLTTLLFALVPAIKATSRNLIERIKDGQHATVANERRAILPRILLGAEVAVALVLVVGAGLVATSLVRIYKAGMGFDPRGLQNIDFSMEKSGLSGDGLIAFYREMGQRLALLPGVSSVSYERMTPLMGYQWDEDFADTTGENRDTFINTVAPGYFSTMRIPLLAGRDFTWNDTPSTGPKIILNQTAARQLFPGANPLGRSIHHEERKRTVDFQVVGIVGDAKYSDIHSPPPATAYFALPQEDWEQSSSYTAVVRMNSTTEHSAAAGPLAGAVHAITAQMAPQIPAPKVTAMDTIIDDALGPERMMTLLAVFFAACALVVTAIGLYGTLAYATARRTTEIGIRMALGAKRSQVAAMVFGQTLWAVMAGALGGLAVALLAAPALAGFLFLTSARDPLILAASVGALSLTTCAASLLPALRAAGIEPMSAIRYE